ncbi:MAG: tryptophan-rich sensory protein [Ruminococcus sp.]|nr:tryptophan-rich sensory protein [Ruminococcus sp.]
MEKKISWRALIVFLLISWGVGGLASFLIRNNTDIYETLQRPAFAPPGWVFPVVWAVLYTLMGISAYLIFRAVPSTSRLNALTSYLVTLIINFAWPLIFFNAQAWWGAFFWLLLLIASLVVQLVLYWRVRPSAALLQIPYLLWISFAAVLNLSIARMN